MSCVAAGLLKEVGSIRSMRRQRVSNDNAIPVNKPSVTFRFSVFRHHTYNDTFSCSIAAILFLSLIAAFSARLSGIGGSGARAIASNRGTQVGTLSNSYRTPVTAIMRRTLSVKYASFPAADDNSSLS